MLKLIKTNCYSYVPIKAITEFWIENYESTNKLRFRISSSETFSITIKKGTTIEQAIKQNLITINEDTNDQSIDTDSTL